MNLINKYYFFCSLRFLPLLCFLFYSFILFIPFFTVSPQQEQEKVETEKEERYLNYKPSAANEIIERFRGNPKELIRNLENKLNEFYLLDNSQKKIQARKDIDYSMYNEKIQKEINANARRLLVKKAMNKKIKGFLLKEAPGLSLMHKTMGEYLMKLTVPEIYRASFHYNQALRYRNLRMSTEIFTSKERLKLLDENDTQIPLANDYRETKNSIEKLTKEIKYLEERNIILDDSLNFKPEQINQIQTPAPYRLEKQANENSIEEQNNQKINQEERFKQLEEDYKQIAEKWNQTSAEFLVEFANVQKVIENKFKEKQKVINKASTYKTSFNQAVDYDYSRNSDFRAYAQLMELASELDQKNPKIALELAREYKSSHEDEKSIFLFKRAVKADKDPNIPEEKKLSPQELKEAITTLGSLSYLQNKFVEAAKHYEKALALEKSQDENLTFLLGKLHSEKTGHYKRAIELLEDHLKSIQEENSADIIERGSQIRKQFLTLNYIAQNLKKLREYDSMLKSLNKLVGLNEELNQNIKIQKNKVKKSFNDLQEAKKLVLNKTKREDLNQFYLAESRYRDEKNTLSKLNTIKNTLPLKPMYFTLAEYWEGQLDIEQAISVYQQAEKQKIFPQEARRRAAKLRRKYQ